MSAEDPDDEVLFEERRPPSTVLKGMIVVLALALIWVNVRAITGAIEATAPIAGNLFGLALFGLIIFILVGPLGTELKHVRVDRQGVWMRSKRLPPEQIGRVKKLTAGQTSGVLGGRVQGHWTLTSVVTYNPLVTEGEPVFIEQRKPDGKTKMWLLGTDRPDELIAAVHEVAGRSQHR